MRFLVQTGITTKNPQTPVSHVIPRTAQNVHKQAKSIVMSVLPRGVKIDSPMQQNVRFRHQYVEYHLGDI
jgi:hydroxymethylpyrimidine/phosphomethylpyrimidine kinase